MNGRILRGALSVFILAGMLAAAAGAASGRMAQAQTGGDDPWNEPVNLSNSGGISLPRMVVDPLGVIHVVWHDELAGPTYTRFAEEAWSEPVSVEFPFEDVAPTLVASDEHIHAFWIDTGRDDALMYSKTSLESVGVSTGWAQPRMLSRYVRGLDVIYAGGLMHLVYLHSLAEPDKNRLDGVIYAQSADAGETWPVEALVYPTRYFRNLRPDEVNVQIVATTLDEQTLVSIVWDNPPLKRVFYARSADGGATWEPAVEVDGPTAESFSGEPFTIRLVADGAQAVRLWHGNLQSGVYCTQYYQASTDGGATWSEREAMLQGLVGCPQDNHLFSAPDGTILLQTIIKDQVYLVAWDGEKWSDPQLQNRLSGFENPVTNDLVVFRCLQPALVGGTRLYVTGCDEALGGDVWITWRDLGPMDDWFPPPSRWGAPVTLQTSALEVYDVDALRDAEGRLHVLWTQFEPAEDEGELPTKRSFYYASWNGTSATTPSVVLRSPDNYADSFSLAYDVLRNRLSVAWNGGKSGELYFTWADVGRATSSLEWSAPVNVPALRLLAGPPHMRIGEDGTIYITYALPVNEERGVYVVSSTDGGKTWSAPAAVFAAGNTDWQAVSAPRLALSSDGTLHVAWSRGSLLGASEQTGVYYSRSLDGGQSWPEAQIAFNEPVLGIWLENSPTHGLHRFWFAPERGVLSVYQDVSSDGGASWSLPTGLSSFGEAPRAVRPYLDGDGRLALVQVAADPVGRMRLGNYVWDGNAWQKEDSLALPEMATDPLYSLAASAGPDGRLAAVYATRRLSSGLPDEPYQVILWNRLEMGTQAATPTRAPQLPTVTAAGSTGAGTAAAPEAPATLPAATMPTASLPAGATPTQPIQAPPTAATQSELPAAPTATPRPGNLSGEEPSPLFSDAVGMALAAGAALLVTVAFVAVSRRKRNR